MNASDQLLRLFEYDQWANQKVIAFLEDHSNFDTFDQALRYLSHLITSEQIWYLRVIGEEYSGVFWPDLSLHECRSLADKMGEKWLQYLTKNTETLNRTITYRNSSGEVFETALIDIMHHLVIHGQHHRAQIAVILRQADIPPPPTDFIFFTRNNFL